MKIFRAIIVDDERYARKELAELLKNIEKIEVVAEAENISAAIEKINIHQPDIVFLDIQLIGETGFDLFEKIEPNFKTIFVTAYDQYAIRAFEVNAFDYLLKPVNPERLEKTIANLDKEDKRKNDLSDTKLLYDDCIYTKLKNSAKFLPLKHISIISAENEYSKIVLCNGQNILVHKSLKKWEEKLPDNHFKRIHRSTIVNINHIEEIKKLQNNTYEVFLTSIEKSFNMSRRYAAKFKQINEMIFDH